MRAIDTALWRYLFDREQAARKPNVELTISVEGRCRRELIVVVTALVSSAGAADHLVNLTSPHAPTLCQATRSLRD